jgi:5-formyltetrahydrofolate cyclo-ligase
MTTADEPTTKADERTRIRAQRSARSQAERDLAASRLAEAVLPLLPPAPATVTAYQSLPAEPGTEPLIAAILGHGHRVLLPRITGRDLLWVEVTSDSTFARGPLGIAEPEGPALPAEPSPLASVDVLLIPGLAVDHQGRRLGQGGGYYDRTLAGVPPRRLGGPLRVAVLYDEEYLDEVPHEPHDCTVDILVTPVRTVRFDPLTGQGEA